MKINGRDNVEVNIATGHKEALTEIKTGETIIKYGYPIGIATKDIKKGEHVHSHNMKTGLSGILKYEYNPVTSATAKGENVTFNGYLRQNGDAGVRNEIWIIPTVGCVNGIAKELKKKTGALALTHPFGCSQLGGDLHTTQKILRGLVNHPNAGGVLVLGLGCENNNIDEFRKILGDVNTERVKFLNTQDVSDELAEGVRLIEELKKYADKFKRQPVSVSKLRVGLKCGGSDGFSGITANPLVGRFSDRLITCGGTAVMTEVPEMFGAETILMNRCVSTEVFDKLVSTVNGYKEYFMSHNQPIYENPSPGNKAGGITTLEEKSLGCITKGGTSPVVDVLTYGDTVNKQGLNLLDGPGNDIVACTNLCAVGCQIILFTTGRGTPLGAPVPTVKIATNTELYNKKEGWLDFNAGELLDGKDLDEKFFDKVLAVASGELTANEKNGYREISIFKDGVML